MRFVLIALLVACSSSKETPPATEDNPAPADPPPAPEKPPELPAKTAEPPAAAPPADDIPLDEDTKQRVADEMAKVVDEMKPPADTSACGIPATIANGVAKGPLKEAKLGGKMTYNYIGQLADPAGVAFHLYANIPPKKGTFTLRASRSREDFARPIVLHVFKGGQTLDGVSGKLVIDKVTATEVTGHLENAEVRQVDNFAYLEGGCTTKIKRVDFTYAR